MTTSTTLEAGDGHVLGAQFARPSGSPRGGLVVIQEIFGVNDHIRSVCDRFAADGWAVLAPAMFDRVERGVELEYDSDGVVRGREIKDQIPMSDVLADVESAVAAMAAEVGSEDRVGVVGFCWGGAIAAAAACHMGDLIGAAVGYYGGGITSMIDVAPEVPLLLHFGELDSGIPLEEVATIRDAWTDVAVHVHAGAEHGFNCEARSSHHPLAAADANDITQSFFTSMLR